MITELIKAQKFRFLSVLLISVMNSFFEVAGLGSFALLLQKAMTDNSETLIYLGFAEITIPVFWLPWLCIVFFLLKAIVNLLYFYLLGRLVYGTELHLNQTLFKFYLSKHDFRGGDSAEMIRRNLLTEVPMFAQNFMQSIFHILSEIILLVSIGSVILYIFADFWKELVFGGFILSALLVSSLLLARPLQRLGRHRQFYTTLNIREVSALASGWKDIKANNLQSVAFARYNTAIENYARYMANMFPLQAAPRVIFEAIIISCFVFGFFYIQMRSDDTSIEIARISVFALAALRIYPSLAKLGSLIALASFARSSHETLINLYREIKSSKKSELAREFAGDTKASNPPVLEISNFNLEIPNQDHSINIENLRIKRGDIVIVRGPNGSGKTTLLDVLSGVSELGSGKLIYNSGGNTPPCIRYCTQFPFYTDGPVAAQAKFDLETPDDVRKILSSSGFFDQPSLNKILALENAQNLSGGEKIKIACAEILARECDLCLLDEPTSPMDKNAIDNLRNTVAAKAASGTAFLIVTHDDSFSDLATLEIQTGGK